MPEKAEKQYAGKQKSRLHSQTASTLFSQNFTEDRNDFEHFSSSRFVTQSAAPLGQIG